MGTAMCSYHSIIIFKSQIIDTENGAELDEGERGEVCIRGPSVMKGYLNNREATQACIDKYGWCYTGRPEILYPANTKC